MHNKQWTTPMNWSMESVPSSTTMVYMKNNNQSSRCKVEINTDGSVYGYMLKMMGKSKLDITKGTLEINNLCMCDNEDSVINIEQGSILMTGDITNKMNEFVESGKIIAYDSTILNTNRWHTTDGDGLFTSGNRIAPWIQNCQWQSVGDDNIIIKTEALQCSQKISSTQYILQLAAADNSRKLNMLQGDTFYIIDPVSGKLLDQAIATNISINTSANPVTYTVTFNKVLSMSVVPGLTSNSPYWYDNNITSSNFLIENSSLTSPRRFGMFILGNNGVVQNNTLTYTEAEAMALHQDLFVNGYIPNNLMICYNTFNNNYVQDVGSTPSYGNPAIIVAYTMTNKGISTYQGITNIIFNNNIFNNLNKVEAMYLSSINGMTVMSNMFNSTKTTGIQTIASILNANAVNFSNNTIKGPIVSSNGSINVQSSSTTNITVINNTFVSS